MGFRFLDDIALADIAFEAEAADLPSLFADSAEALLKTQIDNPEELRRDETVMVELSHEKLDLLLYRFLQELVYFKDANRLLLLVEHVEVKRKGEAHALKARVSGEKLDPARHRQRVDVKAVTLHRLEVARSPKGWKATVVLDI